MLDSQQGQRVPGKTILLAVIRNAVFHGLVTPPCHEPCDFQTLLRWINWEQVILDAKWTTPFRKPAVARTDSFAEASRLRPALSAPFIVQAFGGRMLRNLTDVLVCEGAAPLVV